MIFTWLTFWHQSCGKKLSESSLYRHKKNVHGEQIFNCAVCPYKAKRKYHLQKHIESIHEGVKFPCPHCDYKATTDSSCKKHIKTIHEGIRFQCPNCSHKATQKNDLKRHIKAKHKKSSSTVISHEILKADDVKTDQLLIGSAANRHEYFEEENIKIKEEF